MPPRLIMAVRRGDFCPFGIGRIALLLLYSGGRYLLPASRTLDGVAEYRVAAMMPVVSFDRFPPDKKNLLPILTNLQEKTCLRILF